MLYKTTLAKVNLKSYITKIITPGRNTTFTSIAI
jgi:hypothetical protein